MLRLDGLSHHDSEQSPSLAPLPVTEASAQTIEGAHLLILFLSVARV